LESRVTQGDISTKSEIQQCLGTLLGQVLRDYSHGEDVNLLDSAPCANFPQPETDELSQEQKILKSCMYHDILCLLSFAYYCSHKKKDNKRFTRMNASTQLIFVINLASWNLASRKMTSWRNRRLNNVLALYWGKSSVTVIMTKM